MANVGEWQQQSDSREPSPAVATLLAALLPMRLKKTRVLYWDRGSITGGRLIHGGFISSTQVTVATAGPLGALHRSAESRAGRAGSHASQSSGRLDEGCATGCRSTLGEQLLGLNFMFGSARGSRRAAAGRTRRGTLGRSAHRRARAMRAGRNGIFASLFGCIL